MQKLTRLTQIIALSTTLVFASGCVYKRDIPQGNLVTQSMVEQLQPGMTQDQVAYVMGRPLLEAPFDSNQWDYVFRLQKAYGGVEERRVTLTFDPSGRLVNIEQQGDLSEALPLDIESSLGPAVEGADPYTALPEESTLVTPPNEAPEPTQQSVPLPR